MREFAAVVLALVLAVASQAGPFRGRLFGGRGGGCADGTCQAASVQMVPTVHKVEPVGLPHAVAPVSPSAPIQSTLVGSHNQPRVGLFGRPRSRCR